VTGKYILVVDQGTTSTRTILFDADAAPVATAQQEFPQHYPHPGWIEHDPEDLWRTTLSTARDALAKADLQPTDIAGIGITNQRETTVVWDRTTGQPIYNAIVWQDRRTSDICANLSAAGQDELVRERTGLIIDPYFSATKIAWILDHVDGARARADRGELAFGTVDTFLLWRLTNGAVHATDATNAARTALLDIHAGAWDTDLLRLFRVPASLLPEVRDTAGAFGATAADHLGGAIPVLAMAGDQQSALIGQTCLKPGMVKATYGTGGFILLNTGPTAVRSSHRLLTTIAYQWRGLRHYALEGSIFSAGATVQWLRDALGLISSAAEAGQLAAQADQEQPVYLVPAFAGLGAPYWSSEARGTLVGLTRGTTRKELSRAALESVGFQTRDLLAAMYDDASTVASGEQIIRVDGGMTASDWTMQFLADILDASVDRPVVTETTALGVGLLAGWQAGLYPEPDKFASTWKLERRFQARMPAGERETRWAGWRDAVARTLLDTGKAS
jgi:glycerol kinase